MGKAQSAPETADLSGEKNRADAAVSLRTRSPNYPVYKLESALQKAETLHSEFKRHVVPIGPALEKLGLKPSSSTGAQAIAAMKAYGLIDVQGLGDSRKVSVTDDAAKIIAKPPHPDASALLRKAALAPKIHAELYQLFMGEDGLAPDASIKHYLVFDRAEGRFNDEIVDSFIRQFKATLAFAKLNSSAKTSDEPVANTESVSAGEFVQWESQGVMQFKEPRRVTGKSEDGEWVFVEGSETGLPAREVCRVDPPLGKNVQMMQPSVPLTSARNPPPNPNYKFAAAPANTKQDIYTADSGEVVVRWPAILSAEEYADIEGWLEMLKKKIRRSVDPNLKNDGPAKIEMDPQ